MTMLSEALIVRAAAAHRRLATLQQRTTEHTGPAAMTLRTALRELNDVLEELQLATEQLQSAADDLAAARRDVGIRSEYYEELYENLPLPCVLTDDAGCVDVANSLASRLLNVARLRLSGKPLLLFIPQREQYFQLLAKVRSDGAGVARLLMRPRDKRPREVDIKVSTLPNQAKWCWVFAEHSQDPDAAPY